ncbi:MAG TPA: hypothetical protein VFI47_02825 [Acidimicrobiales bacterium]|nr:hypothetical protein [Acidimicrobiales bacterium]
MPAREPVVVEFPEERRAAVVERMARMAAAGAGWVNVSPGLDVDVPPPPPSGLGALFSGRGPTVPLGTWTPAHGRSPATIGIQHGQGPRAVRTLGERGVPVPAGWRVTQDNPRRGLIVQPSTGSTGEALDEVLAWLLTATGALCPVRRTGEWRAYCYEP